MLDEIMLDPTPPNSDSTTPHSASEELKNITEIFKVYFNQSSGNRDDFQNSLTAIIESRQSELNNSSTNQKLTPLIEALKNIKEHDLSVKSSNLDTSVAVKDSINKTLQCYKQYFLTKFSDDGSHENCDPDVKNILSNFNDTSNDPNDTTPNLLKSLTVRESDKQALEELSRVLNNYLAGLAIETESKINNNDNLADQKDNADKIKNILGVFPGGVTNGVNQVQFACIGGSAERVEEAISALNDPSPEVNSMKSAIDIFSAQIASKVEEGSQIHIKPCARGALMLDTSEVAKKDTHYASPQKDITLRRILEFCYNLANQVKKEIEDPIKNLNKIIIKYEALKEEEPIDYSKIKTFTESAKRLGFNITIDDILAEDANGNKYEFNFDGSVEKKSHLIDLDDLRKNYSTTIPSEKFKKELSKIEKPELDYLKHLLDPKKLFKDSLESEDEPSNRLDVKKIKNLVDLFTAKEVNAEAVTLDEEAQNTQKSKMLAGLVTLRNILDGYKTNDNNYFYFRKFDKKFKEETGKSFEDFFYENTDGKKEIKDEFQHAQPILDTIANRIKHKRGLFESEDEKLSELIYKLVLLESEEKKDEIKKLFTQDPDILELKNSSGENIAKILYQFSEEVLQIALEAKSELVEKITEKNNGSSSLLQIITHENNKELLLNILKKYQEAHQKEDDKDGKKALGEMIYKQELLFRIVKENKVDLLEAIIPMLNSDDLNRVQGGITPLHIACQNGHLPIVEKLIKAGAVLDNATTKGSTPLYIACQNGHLPIVEKLIKAGADLNKATTNGSTPLHMACVKGHAEIVETLINLGASLDKVTTNGSTPLHMACLKGHAEIVETLINLGASLDKVTTKGSTPLYVACIGGHIDIAKDLFEAGANVDYLKQKGHLYGYSGGIDKKLIYNNSEEMKNLIKEFIDPENIKRRDERLKNINKPHNDATSASGAVLDQQAGVAVSRSQARK